MSKKAKKRKAERSGKGTQIVKLILLIILVAAILAGGSFGIWYLLTHGNEIKSTAMIVTHNGTAYTRSANGLVLTTNDEFKVVTTSEDASYSVRIYAKATENDFTFKLGEEPYKWSNMDGRDFTSGFTINPTEGGFTVSFTTIGEIISAVQGADITLTGEAEGELFTLVITSGDAEISLGFSLYVAVTGIGFDTDRVVFGRAYYGTEYYGIEYDTLGSGSNAYIQFNCVPGARAGDKVTFTITLLDLSGQEGYQPMEIVNVLLEGDKVEPDEYLTAENGAYSFIMPSCLVTVVIYLMPAVS